MGMLRRSFFLTCFLTLILPVEIFAQEGAGEINKYSRVVALSSLSADLIASINLDALIGVPGTSLTNKDSKFSGIQRISNGRSQPSVELILSMKPDLVVGAAGFHTRSLNTLSILGVETLAMNIDRWDRLEEASRILESKVVNAMSIVPRISKLCPARKSSETGSSILVLAGISPMLSPGQQSWAGSILERLGLENSTKSISGSSEFSGYITMSNERLLMIKPEKVLVVNPSGDSGQTVKSLLPFFPELQESDFKAVEYYGLINPGSLSSIQNACKTLSSF